MKNKLKMHKRGKKSTIQSIDIYTWRTKPFLSLFLQFRLFDQSLKKASLESIDLYMTYYTIFFLFYPSEIRKVYVIRKKRNKRTKKRTPPAHLFSIDQQRTYLPFPPFFLLPFYSPWVHKKGMRDTESWV